MNAEATIALIGELLVLLTQDALTAEDVAAAVGPLDDDLGGRTPITLRPSRPGIEAARLSLYESGVPYVLELDFAPGARPRVADLTRLLGTGRPERVHVERAAEILFSPPHAKSRWRLAVIGRVAASSDTGA